MLIAQEFMLFIPQLSSIGVLFISNALLPLVTVSAIYSVADYYLEQSLCIDTALNDSFIILED